MTCIDTVFTSKGSADLESGSPFWLDRLELEVVSLVLTGFSSEETAIALGLERRDVDACRTALLKKFGARRGLHVLLAAHQLTQSADDVGTADRIAHRAAAAT